MESWHEFPRAPVASIQRVRVTDVESSTNRAVVPQCQNQQDVFRHAFAEPEEEFQIQVGSGVVLAVCIIVAVDKEAPTVIAYIISRQPFKLDTQVMYLASLLPDLLAFAITHSLQKILKIFITSSRPVLPVKLNAASQHHSRSLQFPRLILLGKQAM